MNTIKIDKLNTLLVAHRGVSGLEKENTIPAFIAAGNRSYYGVECDVYVTKDREVIILHDRDTLRVSGVSVNAKESTYEELKKVRFYDVDGVETKDYYYVPKLSEYLEICRRYEKRAYIEIKDHLEQEDIDTILDVVEKSGYLDNVVFISFYPWNLFKIRDKYPNQDVQFLTNVIDERLKGLCYERNFNLDIRHDLVTKELIDEFHAHGLKVNTFTVDKKDEAEKFASWGIDQITTNILE